MRQNPDKHLNQILTVHSIWLLILLAEPASALCSQSTPLLRPHSTTNQPWAPPQSPVQWVNCSSPAGSLLGPSLTTYLARLRGQLPSFIHLSPPPREQSLTHHSGPRAQHRPGTEQQGPTSYGKMMGPLEWPDSSALEDCVPRELRKTPAVNNRHQQDCGPISGGSHCPAPPSSYWEGMWA